MAAFITSKKYSATDSRQEKLTDAMVMYIAGNLLPLSTVESLELHNFLELMNPRYQLPSRKHLSTKLLSQKTASTHAAVQDQLKQATGICLTLDLWSSRQMRSFLGITCHYIFNWRLQNVMLACKRFKGRHTSDNICRTFQETVAAFDISNKILTITTDNASNMVKAFSLPGFSSDTKPCETLEEDGDDDDFTTVPLQEQDTEHLPEHLPCFAHTLQLVIHDGFKQAGAINKVIAKTSKIVSHVRQSTTASDIMDNEKKLQANNVTRWNSQMKMIRSVLDAPDEKLEQLKTAKLTTYEKNILRDLAEILQPFEEATDLVQSSNTVSSSLVIPCILGLRSHLTAVASTYNCKFLTELRSSLERRLSSYLKREEFQLASILDPRFKLDWCSGVEQKALMSALLTRHAESRQPAPMVPEKSCDPPPKKRSKLLSFMAMDKSTSQIDQENEPQEYLCDVCIPEDSDPLLWWQSQESNLPTLASLAQHYLAIPGSSAPVERLFSIAGKVFRPDRCRLVDSTFENLMFLRCNQHVS